MGSFWRKSFPIARAPNDGYTICIITDQALVINPFLPGADFDPSKTLVPIARPYYLTQMFAIDAGLGGVEFAYAANCAIGAFVARCVNNFGAVCLQDLLAFGTHV